MSENPRSGETKRQTSFFEEFLQLYGEWTERIPELGKLSHSSLAGIVGEAAQRSGNNVLISEIRREIIKFGDNARKRNEEATKP